MSLLANKHNLCQDTASRVSGFLFIALDSALFSELMKDRLSVKVDEILGHSLTGILVYLLLVFNIIPLSIIHDH